MAELSCTLCNSGFIKLKLQLALGFKHGGLYGVIGLCGSMGVGEL